MAQLQQSIAQFDAQIQRLHRQVLDLIAAADAIQLLGESCWSCPRT